MDKIQPISICIITKNECENLRHCLECLAPYAKASNHEIVVVDTGSTDDTINMCREFTDCIYHFTWINDFSAARNFAAEQATHDWIMCIDSDEYVSVWDEEDIQQQIIAHANEIGCIYQCNTCGTGRNQYEIRDPASRLYNRRLFHFEHTIHEQLFPLDAALGQKYFFVKVDVAHYAYAGDAETLASKSQRNITLLKQELEEKPHDVYTMFQLGQSYYMIEDFETAHYYYDMALAEDIDPRQGFVNTLITSYGYTLLELKQYQKALQLEGVYETFSHRADFVFLMGMIYLNNGFVEDAFYQFEKATTYSDSKVVGANSFRAWHNMGVILECTGNTKEALKYYEKCGDFAPAKERIQVLKQS